jgi:hypothetical protein
MRGWKGMEDALLLWVNAKQIVASEVSSPCSSSDAPAYSGDDCSDTPSCNSDSEAAGSLEQDLEINSVCESESTDFNYFEPLPSSFDYNDYPQEEDSWSSFSIMAIYGEAVGN